MAIRKSYNRSRRRRYSSPSTRKKLKLYPSSKNFSTQPLQQPKKRRKVKTNYEDLERFYIQYGFAGTGIPINNVICCVRDGIMSGCCQDTCCSGMSTSTETCCRDGSEDLNPIT